MADSESKGETPSPATPTPQSARDGASKSGTPAPAASPSSAKAVSKSGSKPGSAKSLAGSVRSGSAKSGKSGGGRDGTPNRSPSPKAGKAKKGKKKSKDETAETPTADADEEKGLPDGVIPLFLSSKTQEIFECKTDDDVTEDNLFKVIKKEDIQADLFNRAAISDFAPYKPIIQDYAGDEILIVYDPDFKHGQNFLLATTEEAKNKLMHPAASPDGTGEGESTVPEEEVVYTYIPPESKDWISLGSEKEIVEESLVEHRKRIKISVKRQRRDFGAPYQFSDRNVADAKDGYMECPAYEDKTFDLRRKELNKGTQALPVFVESAAQTDWKYPRNAAIQYEPRTVEVETEPEVDNPEGLTKVVNKFEVALQQNEILDVFYDDWLNLTDDDGSFGSKADSHLKEYQSFTDLQFSKGKTITAIEWHPTIRGIVAVSVSERMSFDDRIDHAAQVIMNPSLILIWSFADPIHPQLLLEAPDDIMSFKFSASDPNIICGGCINGQVVLWDISQYTERLKQPRSKRKDNPNSLAGFEDEHALDTPIIRYCAVSAIEHSHKAPVTDILWLPDHIEVNRMGEPQENKSGHCCQIMTCATDQVVMYWDTRPTKGHQQPDKKDHMVNPMGVPETFKHLDLSWKPMLKVNLYKSEPGGDHAPTKFSISESQGDKSALDAKDDGPGKTDSRDTMGGGFYSQKVGSAKRTLGNIQTHFYVGTEDGEIVYVDWMPQKDQDSGKLQTPKPDYYHSMSDGPIVALQRSPFFKDIIICVGGWNFTIWKEGVTSGPILSSAASSRRLTSGYWSPTRPAVFFITKQDGSVDIWDLLDRTHEPSMNQAVSPAPITSIFPFQVTNKQHLLAVGDNTGTLHILEIPWSLRQPTSNEHQGVSNYFDREVKRRAFVVARWDFREKEKMEMEQEIKRKAGIAPNVNLSEDEIEYRLKLEYQQYAEEESNFLREMGLKEAEEEPLPATD